VTSPFIHYHFRLAVLLPASAQAHLELRARLGLGNTPPLGQPHGNFGAAAFGSIAMAGGPGNFVLAPRLKS
jgi:hypothetical protein